MSIGVMRSKVIKSIVVTPDEGGYYLFADGHKILDVGTSSMIQLSLDDGRVRVRSFDQDMGSYHKIMFLSENADNSLRLKPVYPDMAIKKYDDHLEITANNSSLLLTNKVALEDYVAGVVEAEVGYKAAHEFLKVQAILARTYALSHASRHVNDGYDLCDDVHCQVYAHKTIHYNILDAVRETKGMVLIDNNLHMITAAFHSNCGGQTSNSEDVWLTQKPYLRSVVDTFCTSQHNAHWTLEVSKSDWKQYLKTHQDKSIDDTALDRVACSFPQNERQVFYASTDIPLKNIRSDWNLKSTYFSVVEKGEHVILNGRGYGHGVGLCQEGAMRMALLGKNYKEILEYYYEGVNLVSIEALKFFLEE
ncbi:MAG: SpoIID/LytB domain-containing protein [Flavobacteriales bacterium]|nr:SpoIID/LytB domain-containing protein [Flavobacteriales bacterium]MCB9447720.1 SpoIID/LytB domain-containing protein [Flavobacteriales bacterium]